MRRPRLNIHRGRTWVFYASNLILLVIAVSVFIDAGVYNSRRWIAGVAIAILVAILLLDRGPRARALSALVRSRFRLCPRCRYDLSALDRARSARTRTGTCPECGHAFNIDDIRRYWRTDLGYSRSPRRR